MGVHVQENILADLQRVKPGNAVFVYRLESPPDAAVSLDAVEQTYFAFRRHMRDVIAATTCECNACRRMPQLDLKFIAHFGSFIVDRVGMLNKLTGTDVVIVHRLLKNHVVEGLGLRAYAMYPTVAPRARATASSVRLG